MDSLDVIKVCLRRWYLFIPIVLIAAGAGVGLSKQVKPSFTATGSYAFVYSHPEALSPTAADPRNANPLITNGQTILLGEAVSADLNSATKQDALGGTNRGYAPDQAPTTTRYSITLPQNSASYVVQTWADSAQAAANVVQAVLTATPNSAKEAQVRAGAPEASLYGTYITAPTQTTELPAQSPMKLLLTLVALGAVAGAAASLVFDRILGRRASRRTPARRPRPRPRTRTTGAGINAGGSSASPEEVPTARVDTPASSSAALSSSASSPDETWQEFLSTKGS